MDPVVTYAYQQSVLKEEVAASPPAARSACCASVCCKLPNYLIDVAPHVHMYGPSFKMTADAAPCLVSLHCRSRSVGLHEQDVLLVNPGQQYPADKSVDASSSLRSTELNGFVYRNLQRESPTSSEDTLTSERWSISPRTRCQEPEMNPAHGHHMRSCTGSQGAC